MKPLLPPVESRWTERMQRALHAELDRILSVLNPYRQIPAGGTTGQILAKATQRDYDVEWTEPGAGGGDVSISGTPSSGQYGRWASASSLAGVAASTVKTDLALVKGDVGLGNVDNTSDSSKPVSTAQAAALQLKASNALAFFFAR